MIKEKFNERRENLINLIKTNSYWAYFNKIKEELTINNINVIYQNEKLSTIIAGFGVLSTSVILMVNEEDVAQAERIIEGLGVSN